MEILVRETTERRLITISNSFPFIHFVGIITEAIF
jgi:hypothetical protein